MMRHMPMVRFSLLNLLLFTVIIALSITVYRLSQEIGPLRIESKRLNEERGSLVIEDDQRVNAIRVPTRFAKRDGTFRVFIPEGEKYLALAVVNKIPKTGLPDIKRSPSHQYGVMGGGAHGQAHAVLPPGEYQIALSVEQRQNGERYVRLAGGQHGFLDMTVHVSKGAWPETKPETYAVYGHGVKGTTESVAAGQPLVLLRHRTQAVSEESLNVSYSRPEPDYLLDGMMLWIEPLPSEAKP